jgi:hypothetical protein
MSDDNPLATHTVQCPAFCVPDPYYFSKIYGVVKRGEDEQYTELFRTAPPPAPADDDSGDDSTTMILLFFMVFLLATIGAAYYFRDDIAKQLNYKDFDDFYTRVFKS